MTYLADVFLHPLESLDLIFQTIVQAGSILNFFTGQKAVRPNTVIESNDDDIQV